RNSIVANNAVANIVGHASTGGWRLRSLGFNLTNDTTSPYLTDSTDLLGVDPKLGPLNNNGGHVETRAPLGGSPALDAGHSSGYPNDARGVACSFDALGAAFAPGDLSDVGAAEMHPLFVSNTDDAGPGNLLAGSLREAITLAIISEPPGLTDILF